VLLRLTTYEAHGGVLTVRSELGEPVHKVAKWGVKLWKEFDDIVFKLPKEKRVWLTEHWAEMSIN
jgi:fatty acid synthase subunit alpha